MTRLHKYDRSGLTILELLVVVAVLGVLAALLFSVVRGMIDRAAVVNCAANMRTVGTLLQTWRTDHDGYFPTGNGKRLIDPITDGNSDPQIGASVTEDLDKGGYLKKGDAPICPATRLSAKGKTLLKSGESAKAKLKTYGSYNLNTFLSQVKPSGLSGQNWWGTNPYPGDSRMLFLAESHAGIGGYPGFIWANSQYTTALDGVDYGTSINVKGRNHGGYRLNFMFLDGHIVPLAPKITGEGDKIWSATSATLDDPEIPFETSGRNGKYIGARRLRADE